MSCVANDDAQLVAGRLVGKLHPSLGFVFRYHSLQANGGGGMSRERDAAAVADSVSDAADAANVLE